MSKISASARVLVRTFFLPIVAVLALMQSAAAESMPSIEYWEQQLNRAGAGSNYERAADLLTGPIIQAGDPKIVETVSTWLTKAFGENGFKADTISVMSSAEKGERRLLALFNGNRYAFVFMVFHKRDDGWVALNFSLEPNYPAIRQRF